MSIVMRPRRAIVLIVIAELFGTSLWFTANGVAAGLAGDWGIGVSELGWLTSAVQAGFIVGTLLLALTSLPDRFRAAHVFFFATLVGAAANAAFALFSETFLLALTWRFLTGLALAGIYPLGMKLVVSWAPERRGEALGWLVGMLVLGTALPHLMQAMRLHADWSGIVLAASVLAVAGGVLVLLAGDGPHRSGIAPPRPGQALAAFGSKRFRAAAFGYFGHMWELYALWTVAPLIIAGLLARGELAAGRDVSFAAFLFIALGAAGCVAGGWLSRRIGSARVAFFALLVSGALCVVFPLLLAVALPLHWAALLLAAWGVCVVADSPQFSALIARHAPPETLGSALAIVNGIGFFITVLSISLVGLLWPLFGAYTLLVLAPGPLSGLILMRELLEPDTGSP